MSEFTCSQCLEVKPIPVTGGTGYGTYGESSDPVCYACCANVDRETLRHADRTALYLAKGIVTNWPGTLTIVPSRTKNGRHNIAGTRIDVWFTGPDGAAWHGVNIGDNDILRCRKLKSRSVA